MSTRKIAVFIMGPLFIVWIIGCRTTSTPTPASSTEQSEGAPAGVAATVSPSEPIEPAPSPTPKVELVTISYNEIKEGQLDQPAASNEWTFQAQAGERINLVVNGQFDSYLELYGPDDELIASNDDSNNSLNAALFDIPIERSGLHTVLVRGYNTAPGRYALALTGGHPTTSSSALVDNEPRTVVLSQPGSKWRHEGQKGTYLTITATADNQTDTFLALYGPDGTLLISDDDSGFDLNAEIVEFQLPEDGLYTVHARTISEAGLATITLRSSDKLTGGGELLFGETQPGTIQAGRVHRWTFSGEAGQIVNVTLTSTDFDTFLELRDSQDIVLVENDDQAGATDSAINQFVLPATDQYTIIARGLSETDVGAYGISLKLTKVPAGGGPLLPDTKIEAVLLPGQADRWSFEAQAGAFVTLQTQSTLLDTYLELYAPDGALVIADDDSGGGLNAAIPDFPIQESGVYEVRVNSAQADSNQSGVYEIILTLTETLQVTGQLLSGESQKVSLQPNEQHSWLFEAEQGDFATIQMESTTLDTYLSLYNSEGTLLAVNDDFVGKQATLANFIIPNDGQYRVLARSYSTQEAGDYIISLETTAEPLAIEPSP